jgi:DNA-binding NarL/FixJ family response regulator
MSDLRQELDGEKGLKAALVATKKGQSLPQRENGVRLGKAFEARSGGKRGAVGVVVVDPSPLFRAGTVEVLRSGALRGAAVAGEAAGVAEGAELARAAGAGVLVLGDASVEEVREAVRALPGCAVVALVSRPSRGALVGMLAAGVAGIAPRGLSAEQLLGVVEAAAAAGALRAPSGGGRRRRAPVSLAALPVETERAATASPVQDGFRLTAKEKEVLALLASGASNNEIAKTMRLKPATVKTHLTHIYAKLGARGRHDALARAFSAGAVR